MAGVLDGLRVLDMGHVVAVPSAGAILADWGAEVLKIEPLTGDMARDLRPTGSSRPHRFYYHGANWNFQLLNRNKKSLAVDLKQAAGKDIVYKLVPEFDIFMSNYELGALQKLKMDYATLSRLNPGLVYGVLTGYGTTGPDKDERGFDFAAAWAHTGAQHLTGEPGSAPPPQRGGMMDRVAGTHIVAGLLAALWHKEKTGQGQEIEFSLYHSGVWSLAEDIEGALMKMPIPKHDRTKPYSALWNTYRTQDNRWLQLVMHQPDLQWPDFCRALERPQMINDPRFNSIDARDDNCRELIRILDEIFAGKTLLEWEKRLRENNCIFSRIQTPEEVIHDPQALTNNFFAEIKHPLAGPMKVVMSPVKFKQDPAIVKSPAPDIGQHTRGILSHLGYSQADIDRLQEQKVIL